MAQFGIQRGERGTLEIREGQDGLIQGFFVPTISPTLGTAAAGRLSSGVKLIEADPSNDRITIFPIDTRPTSEGFLGPKYSKIRSLVLPADVQPDTELSDILDTLRPGFLKDYEYGLGLAQENDVIIHIVEDNTECSRIEFITSGDTKFSDHTFMISFGRFDRLCEQLRRIRNRGSSGVRRVKEWYVHNDFADELNLSPLTLSLGRLNDSKWMTRVAAGEEPINGAEQEALIHATAMNAKSMASSSPKEMIRLQRDIESVNLMQLISTYESAMHARHNENWWQRFFEENVFALQLLFGGSAVFVDSQVPIGDKTGTHLGKKIADYLLKNELTNNAALVEIKKPSTKLLKKKPYRREVYGVQAEIGEAVTQVLDQALELVRHEEATKTRTSDKSWRSNAPRCFVVAGLASELDTDAKKKSFDLYRENLSNVRLVTYDEVLSQLTDLHAFIAADVTDGPKGVAST